ncbi:hypothetical protein SARC_08588 [Sphaeroforma arctica JP610]|uniref:Uncharacterized protein n=1 Tax=Sphaeroforma arctica JP610 TaxID=667725 RepID=A0A0L0FQL1_9EUKA|nr:hypothetical protein SARC_08588 [Sphaeroforma arctica JP610]KNC78999.1 hypothetical protein SARC_08588 [Sphaeroforma arctica JP610]|eukprot:XP_014152901.1 hypothetical protein SARC_08588 [Sphaeroforma arctica JP610]
MHTVDPWMLSDGTWVAGIDGDTQYNIPITTFVLKWLGLLMGLCACLIWYRCNIHANRLRIWRTLPSNDSWDGGFNRKTLMSGWDTRDSSMRRVNSAPSRGDTAGGTCATS